MTTDHIYHPEDQPLRQKRRRTGQDDTFLHSDIAWTAARCNRILRTISYRLATLRRLCLNAPRHAGSHTQELRRLPTEHWSTADPVWVPGGCRKVPGKTYTAKGKVSRADTRNASASTRDAAAIVPSVLMQTENDHHPDPTTSEPRLGEAEVRGPIRQRASRQLPVLASSAVQEAETGLVTALESLLSMTMDVQPEARLGASTLLKTCLRTVPAYIKLYEDDSCESRNRSTELTTEVISDLEALGPRQGRGWHGLRDVVRSQGLGLVCQAVTDKLLHDELVHVLIDTCSRHHSVVEGQQILESWILSAEGHFQQRMAKLKSFTLAHRCDGFKFRTLRKLLELGATAHVKIFSSPGFENDLISGLSGSAHYDALAFLRQWTTISLEQEACNAMTKQARRSFKSVTMRLAVVAIAGSLHRDSHLDTSKIRAALDDASYEVLLGTQDVSRKTLQSLAGLSDALVFCTQILAILDDDLSGGPRLSNASDSILYRALRGGGRLANLPGLQTGFSSELVAGLIALDNHLELALPTRLLDDVIDALKKAVPDDETLLRAVGISMIEALRQRASLGGQDCDEYLRCITSYCAQPLVPRTPCRPSTSERFRWEEGLCEWIKATPFAGQQQPGDVTNSDNDSTPDRGMPSVVYCARESPSLSNCSPDVLAGSPMTKRARLSLSACPRGRPPQKQIIKVVNRRKARGRRMHCTTSVEEDDDNSGDELAL